MRFQSCRKRRRIQYNQKSLSIIHPAARGCVVDENTGLGTRVQSACGRVLGTGIHHSGGEFGFCGFEGEVLDRVEGFTGSGYDDTDIGLDYSVSWSVSAPAAGQYALVWRYGNGGGDGTDRPARVVLNGRVAREQFSFSDTGDWTNWTESDTLRLALAAGYNSIRLEALSISGLGNIDYLKVDGEGIAAVECVPTYVLRRRRVIRPVAPCRSSQCRTITTRVRR